MKLPLVIAMRALGSLSRRMSSVFAAVTFLSVSGALFADGLFAAEGTAVSAPSVWAIAVAHVIPLLCALITMRLWIGDGISERTELDLVVPVPERTFAFGRFAAAYVMVLFIMAFSLTVPLAVLPVSSPALSSQLKLVRFLPAFAALAVFAMPIVAIGSMFAAMFRNPAPAAVTALAVTYAVPFAVFRAMLAWCPAVRTAFPEHPVIARIADAADGFLSFGYVVSAFALTMFALYASSKAFAMRRIAGGARALLKVSSVAAMFSALVTAVLLCALALRLDFMVEWPGAVRTASISARTREILSEITDTVRISAYMEKDKAGFLPVARLLRLMQAESRTVAGAGIKCEFVDPRWDPNAAGRLVRAGAGEDSIVFSSGRRRIVVKAKDFDESACASAIQRLSMPARSESVLFTSGHGEPSVDDFGPSGLGDAARALRQDGYCVGTYFSLTSSLCAKYPVLAIVGARTPFSDAELRDIGAFISHGGRLLVADSFAQESGIRRILDRIGISPDIQGSSSAGTSDGSDIVVSEFADHTLSAPLHGSAVIFSPGSCRFSLRRKQNSQMHGFSIDPLCIAGESAFAVAAEKDAALKSDLAIRPSRLVVIGDKSFFLNRSLHSRANANKDFFLNAVAWLAGLDISGAAGSADNVLSVGMDRSDRVDFLMYSLVLPSAVLAGVMLLWIRRGKRRTRR